MKKTIIAALLATSSMACGTTHTTTVTGSSNGNWHGWTTTLLDYSTTPDGFASEEQLALNSVSITAHAAKNNFNSYLAVYELGEGTISNSTTLTYIGVSSNSFGNVAANDVITFNFSGVNVDTESTYAFLFFSTSTTAATMEGVDTIDAYKNVNSRGALNFTQTTTGDDKRIGISSGDIIMSAGTASATYITKTLAVPEPATATLSLLALAGLAARRRRK